MIALAMECSSTAIRALPIATNVTSVEPTSKHREITRGRDGPACSGYVDTERDAAAPVDA
ncbi:hypothetical protein GCM10020255_057170 [Rhodococcus baikonurensis]